MVLINSSFNLQVHLRRPWCHCPHLVPWLSLTDHLGLFSLPPVLCLSGNDCLRSECFLQLPGLARSGQQRGHESDGWGLLLSQLCCGLSHSWVLAQSHPLNLTGLKVSNTPEEQVQAGTDGLPSARSGEILPTSLVQQKVMGWGTGWGGCSYGSALSSENFNTPGWTTLLTSTKTTNRTSASDLL